MRHSNEVYTVEFLNSDAHVLSKSRKGVIRVWDSRTTQPVAPAIHVGRRATAHAVSPDGQWVAIGTGTNNARGRTEQYLRLWDLATGEPISPPLPHGDTIACVTISPDGNRVATSGRDGHVRVFDIPTDVHSRDELRQLSAIVSGVQLDESDNLIVVDESTFSEYWDELRTRRPEDFVATADEENAWLRQQINVARRSGTFPLQCRCSTA